MTVTNSPYTVTKIKTFRGMEGPGFNSVLCRDGTPVAKVDDDASGGPLRFDWLDRKAPAVEITRIPSYLPNSAPVTFAVTPEEARLYAHVDTLPPTHYAGMTLAPDPDTFVSTLVNDVVEVKQLKSTFTRAFKTKVVGIVNDDVLTFKIAPTPEGQAAVEKHNPGVEILNGLSVDDAVAHALVAMKRKDVAQEQAATAPAEPAVKPRRKRAP